MENIDYGGIADGMHTIATVCGGLMSGIGALVWHGYTNMHRSFVGLVSDDPRVAEMRMYGIILQYRQNPDTDNFVEPHTENPRLLIPTRERAIVDYMRFESITEDDENLMLAIDEYLRDHDSGELLRVAEFYGVREQMEQAIGLSRDYMIEAY